MINNLGDSKQDRLSLKALSPMLRSLSQLGRSGVVRLGLGNNFRYFEVIDGEISRFLISEDELVTYLIYKLRSSQYIDAEVEQLLIESKLCLREFSIFLVKEKFFSHTEIPGLLMKFAMEIMYSSFEELQGTLDFNIDLNLLSDFEDGAYILSLYKSPGQIFLDFWEKRRNYLELTSMGSSFIGKNGLEFGTVFSNTEKKILKNVTSGARLESLLSGIFETRDEIVDTLLRLSRSGILEVASEIKEDIEPLDHSNVVSTTESLEEKISVNRFHYIVNAIIPYLFLVALGKFALDLGVILKSISSRFVE